MAVRPDATACGRLTVVDQDLGLDHPSCGAATGKDLGRSASGQLRGCGRTPPEPRHVLVRIVPAGLHRVATGRRERKLRQPPQRHQAAELEAREDEEPGDVDLSELRPGREHRQQARSDDVQTDPGDRQADRSPAPSPHEGVCGREPSTRTSLTGLSAQRRFLSARSGTARRRAGPGETRLPWWTSCRLHLASRVEERQGAPMGEGHRVAHGGGIEPARSSPS